MRTKKEIKKDIEECNARLKALWIELDNAKLAKRKIESKKYESRKALLEDSAKIFEKILKPDDFVKVTGSRTSNLRQVVAIKNGQLVGAVCHSLRKDGNIDIIYSYDVVTCGTNKITAVLRDGKWITAKEIIAENS